MHALEVGYYLLPIPQISCFGPPVNLKLDIFTHILCTLLWVDVDFALLVVFVCAEIISEMRVDFAGGRLTLAWLVLRSIINQCRMPLSAIHDRDR